MNSVTNQNFQKKKKKKKGQACVLGQICGRWIKIILFHPSLKNQIQLVLLNSRPVWFKMDLVMIQLICLIMDPVKIQLICLISRSNYKL